jgi:hypothetical protein
MPYRAAPRRGDEVTPEERHNKIEADIEKHNEAIAALIVVGRSCLDSIKELREVHREADVRWEKKMQELREAQAATDEKLNILIETVDRIIRERRQSDQKGDGPLF